jgi:hypothetical protein
MSALVRSGTIVMYSDELLETVDACLQFDPAHRLSFERIMELIWHYVENFNKDRIIIGRWICMRLG